MLDIFYQELDKNKEKLGLALNFNQLLENEKKGLVNAILSIEEGGVIEGDINNLIHSLSSFLASSTLISQS